MAHPERRSERKHLSGDVAEADGRQRPALQCDNVVADALAPGRRAMSDSVLADQVSRQRNKHGDRRDPHVAGDGARRADEAYAARGQRLLIHRIEAGAEADHQRQPP